MSSSFVSALLSDTWSVTLIILFFGGSIFVHELGHFLAARRRGLVIERFSIGFGPRLFGWRRDGIDYRISLLPLGGYVALPQLAGMSAVEGESTVESLPPLGFASKVIVSVMGAVFNMLFAFVLAVVLWIAGVPTPTTSMTTRIGAVSPTLTLPDGSIQPAPAAMAGLRPGDIIRSIDGKNVRAWTDVQQLLFYGAGRTTDGRPHAVLGIERDGARMPVEVFPLLAGEEGLRMLGVEPADEMLVYEVFANSPAASAGLMAGDRITAAGGIPMFTVAAFREHLQEHKDGEVAVSVDRAGTPLVLRIQPRMETLPDGSRVARAGFAFQSLTFVHPGPLSLICDMTVMTLRGMYALVHPSSDVHLSQMSGPPGIIRAIHETAQIDFRLVLWMVLLINVSLAIFNLLPIPVLDGGHILFAAVAVVRGRPLPARFIQATQSVFIVLFLALMLYVSVSDIRRWIRDANAEAPARPVPAQQPLPDDTPPPPAPPQPEPAAP